MSYQRQEGESLLNGSQFFIQSQITVNILADLKMAKLHPDEAQGENFLQYLTSPALIVIKGRRVRAC